MTEVRNRGVTVNYEVQGIQELLARIPGEGQRNIVAYNLLRRVGMAIEAQAKLRIRTRTGDTRRRITSSGDRVTLTGFVGDFGPGVGGKSGVALWLERGTGLFGPLNHRIFPTHARSLAWPVGASGVGKERADMGLSPYANSGGLMRGIGGAVVKQTLRRTGSHTTAHTRSGSAQWAFRRSIAGMRPRPFFLPAYEATLPLVPLMLDEAARKVFDPTTGSVIRI